MDVMVVARGIPSSRYPLNGIFEFDQAKALAAAGMEVTFIAIDLRSIRRIRRWGIHHGVRDGVKWYEYNIPLGRFPLNFRNKIGAWALNHLYKMIYKDSEKPDVLHAHFAEFGYIATKISRKYKIPLVITEHSSEMNCENPRGEYLACARKTYGAVDKCIAVSSQLAQSMIQKTGYTSEVVPNVVDLDVFSKTNLINHEGIRFVAVGALIERKRHDLLIDAFEKIHKKHNNTNLCIIGEGPLKYSLLKKISNKGLLDCVKLYGFRTRESMAQIFSQCDCLVFPSQFETFGVVCIEAMAAGLPVIATACGGPEDYIKDSVGDIIPVDDLDALVLAMEKIVSYPNSYDREFIKLYTSSRFSPKQIAKKLINIYQEVINRKDKC